MAEPAKDLQLRRTKIVATAGPATDNLDVLTAMMRAGVDVVRLNAYVSSAEYLGGYMKVRDQFVGKPPPASTLMIVQGFARPEFKVEIEAVAAQAS